MRASKLNDPLRWFIAPGCIAVSVMLATPIVMALLNTKKGDEGPALLVALLFFLVLGVPATIFLCTGLIVSRLNVLIQATEHNTDPTQAATPITTTPVAEDQSEPVKEAPAFIFKRSKLQR